jgi:hypothetical protein
MALRVTALVPVTMAVLYFILLVAFKKPEHIEKEVVEENEAIGAV